MARGGFGPRFVGPLLVGSMLNPVNSTMIATALFPIGSSFGVGPASTAWLVASLYLASAVAQPAMGAVADRIGPRRVYLAGLVLVAAAGVGGVLAPSLGVLVGVRVLIGVGTSAAYPAAMAMVRAQSTRLGTPVPGIVLGALTIAALASAAVGPALGGLLVGVAGWRSIFAVNLPLAAVGVAATLGWLPRDEPRDAPPLPAWRVLDVPGVAVFAAALTALLVFLMGLATPSWPLLGACLALGVGLALWERRAQAPFVDVRMLARNAPLLVTYARVGLTSVVLYGVLYGFTQWLEEGRGLSPWTAGVLMLPMSVLAAVCSAVGSRGRRVRGPLLIGTVAMLAGSLALLGVGAGAAVAALVGVGLLFGVPNGLITVGNQAAMYGQAPAEHAGRAAGLFRTSQYVGAILSSGLIGVVFGARAGDGGLHALAAVMMGISAALVVATLADRTIARPRIT